MVEEFEAPTSATVPRKRKNGLKGHGRGGYTKKKKVIPGMEKRNKVSQKMQKLYRKRARAYNSDDSGDDKIISEGEEEMEIKRNKKVVEDYDDDEKEFIWEKEQALDEEDDEVPRDITKFSEGCKAFRVAFQAIMSRHIDDDKLGPVLAGHKKLVAAKLAEEVAEKKNKGEAKKEKRLIEEKGHTLPANFLDSHEKFLIGVATKGVVKLFNAVSKAQNAQKGLNPSRFKDTKALTKRRKEAFISELSRSSEAATKASTSNGGDGSQPAWAPLRDTFMLTNPKLKDWDKMEEQSDI